MKEKIFKALKDAILVGGKTSVSDATINLYVGLIDVEKITDESQIAEAIKPYVPVLQATQANINSVAANSSSTKESELKTKYEKEIEELKKSKPNDPPAKTDIEKAMEAAFATYSEKVITPLVQSIQTMQGEKLQTSLSQKLTEALKSKNIPEWYYNTAIEGRSFKDESEVTAFAEGLGGKWDVAKQELANNGFKETVPPATGDTESKEIDSFVSAISEGTKQIVESKK